MSTYKLAYLLYDSRSGSTLLASKLDTIEGISVIPESDFTSRVLSYKNNWFTVNLLVELFRFLNEEIQFQDLEISEREFVSYLVKKNQKKYSKKDIIYSIIDLYLIKQQEIKIVVVKHSPTNYLRELIEEINPKFIHIIRDGRGIHNSKKKSINLKGKPFSNNIYGSALNWKYKFKLYAKLNSYVIKYEDMLVDEKSEVQKLVKWIEPNVIFSFQDIKEPSYKVGKSQTSFHQNINKGIIKDNGTKWEVELDEFEVWALQKLEKKFMLKYNYNIKSYHLSFYKKSIYSTFLLATIIKYYLGGLKNMIFYIFFDNYKFKRKISKIFNFRLF